MKFKLLLILVSASVLFFQIRQSNIYKKIIENAYINKVTFSGDFLENAKQAEFHGTKVTMPNQTLSFNNETKQVLGSNTDKKRIEVDLSTQKLYAYEGDKKVFEFLVSTGKWGRTPVGEFRIWSKLKYVLMSGGSQEAGTYYYLPNVPYTMFFSNDEISKGMGYSIHGTYWHDNFGQPMSHGCVNMKTEEVEQLFSWANPTLPKDTSSVYSSQDDQGTRVVIYGTAPNI